MKTSSIRRSIMALFAPDKGVNPHTRYPDTYYRNIWLNKQMFDGVELVGKIERIILNEMFNLLPQTLPCTKIPSI